MLNVAIIGLRGHFGIMLDGIVQMPDVRLAAIADEDAAILERVKQHPAVSPDTRTYADYRELLAKEADLHIAGVCGTDDVRAEIACACAQRGLHLMTEKPLAINLEGVEQVRDAVTKAGVRLTMMISMRYAPAFKAMRAAVAEGLVGEVIQMTMQKSYRLGQRPAWMKSRRTFSGIIPFIGIHAMDLMQWTSGRDFAEGMAYQSNVAHPELGDLHDNASVLLKLDNGGTATARLDYLRPEAAPTHGDDRLRIAGSKGVLEVIGDHSEPILITANEAERRLPLEPEQNHFVDYVHSIKTGEPCLVPDADCYRISEIVLKLGESAETGRPILL